ncbi:MAG: peroxide stress protein YaaA [Rubellimicrobium sp.]|nr:peroxide stress protein YaaA [Rubellimicrobium sp.]
MLTLISPAKSLDLSPAPVTPTAPLWPDEANRLARTARNLTLGGLRELMDISDDLARLNRDRFRAFEPDPAPERTYPAAFAFNGDTYRGLDFRSLDAEDHAYAQDHLRILSGLYGLLRPLDAIQPYRLEMGSRLKTRRGATLYEFWGDRLARALKAQAAALGTGTLINCASQEYFAAADRPALGLRVVTPVFMEVKGGRASIVSFHAKRARGAMARFIIENRIESPEGIKAFATGGYAFDPDHSEGDRWVFLRETPAG